MAGFNIHDRNGTFLGSSEYTEPALAAMPFLHQPGVDHYAFSTIENADGSFSVSFGESTVILWPTTDEDDGTN